MKIQLQTVFYVTNPPQIYNNQIIKTKQLALPLETSNIFVILLIIRALVCKKKNILYHNNDISTYLLFILKNNFSKDKKHNASRYSILILQRHFKGQMLTAKERLTKELCYYNQLIS